LNLETKVNSSRYKLFVISLEPNPYTIDLWNKSKSFKNISTSVVFIEKKDFLPDSGHDFRELPIIKFKNKIFSGKNFLSKLFSLKYIFLNIFKTPHDIYFVNGYHKFQTAIGIIFLIIARKKFLFCVDKFNNGKINSKFSIFAYIYRYIFRLLIFKFSIGIMTCGEPGIKSVLKAGCLKEKVYNFPYVIDKSRLINDLPENIPLDCKKDIDNKKIILTFSGRMIPRKGLKNLIDSISKLDEDLFSKFAFWIEGDGPLLNFYKRYSDKNLKKVNYKFLGFCQYKLHSWLIRNSTIIVVPSLQDNWGIVIDEAQQLGKLTISSDGVSSGLDRIKNGVNGFIYTSTNCIQLSEILKKTLIENTKLTYINKAAEKNPKTITPVDNISLIDEIYNGLL